MPERKEVKPGVQTSEFYGKILVQILTLVAMFIPDAHIDPLQGLAIVAALEGIYALGRSIVKAFHDRINPSPPVVVVEKVG